MHCCYHPFIPSVPKDRFILLVCIGLVFVLPSCEPEPRPVRSTGHIRLMDDNIIRYNHEIVRSENNEIVDYILRHQWKMKLTSTGLRYMVYVKGNGKKIVKGSEVRLKFKMNLLSGNEIYSSDVSGIKIIYPGTSEGETGLQEGLLLMQEGDHAKLIVPSHLAFGLLGDMKKIPSAATIVYDIEILSQASGNR